MSLIEKELRNGVLVKIYDDGNDLPKEIKENINRVCVNIIKFDLGELKLVFDYENNAVVNVFDSHYGKKPIYVLDGNKFDNITAFCESYQKILPLFKGLTDVDLELFVYIARTKYSPALK